MKRLLIIFVAMAVSGSVSIAAKKPLRAPDIPQGETRYYKSYYATPKDEPDMDIVSQRQLHDESPKFYKIQIRWNGEGKDRTMTVYREENCFNKNVLKTEFVFNAADGLKLLRADRKWIAPDGALLRERDITYDHPSFKYPDDMFHVMSVEWAIRSMEFVPENELGIYVWLDYTVVYPLIVRVIGEERIKVPAGEFDCWKVEVQVDRKGVDDLMGAIVARTQSRFLFWMEKGGTHGMVRLSWPISSGGFGKKPCYQTQDLVKVEINK